MLVRLSELSGKYLQILGNKDIQNYEVYNNYKQVIGRVVDALLDEQRNVRFLIINLAPEIANKQVLLPWQVERIDINNERIYVDKISPDEAANLPNYNPVGKELENLNIPPVKTKLPLNEPQFYQPEIIGQLESCAPLEACASLESSVFLTPLWQIEKLAAVPATSMEPTAKKLDPVVSLPVDMNSEETESSTNLPVMEPNREIENAIAFSELTDSTLIEPPTLIVPPTAQRQIIDAQIINLLQERLVIDRQRRKIGEVIVRKEIETRIVEVPVRREKLIVEQISPERKQLASIDLGLTTNDSVQLIEEVNPNQTVSHEFSSPEAATEFLQGLTNQSNLNLDKIRIDLTFYAPISTRAKLI
ncbi:PRC-barrel domain-containing protein [Merismopedia glauca]|uniref:DUF2382 domain-containing protein n=1 Tax=Merismopedia glauca CCAP 1448/3 TaxID=1296344 RepID=A0A2T1C6E4_9CYAN|nr:PRC-barrel domain-containing protein [Merismopedia glauca]PSB03804.1 hypothetical protein C7B64_06745 [Merismopedia glauca CCAP 1448/3]